jgi:hypothetical protein
MKTTIEQELKSHLLDLINDGVLTDQNKEDWHFHAFNEDYYMIGYYQASQWLLKHDIDPFEAIGICNAYEQENFGEITTSYNNSEKTVNMLVYICGEQLLNEIDAKNIKELKKALK